MTLAGKLRAIGFTQQEYYGTSARHAALRDDAVAVALRLFRDHLTITRDQARPFLDDAGLLIEDDAGVHSRYRLGPVDRLYLASDWDTTRSDAVLPPGETTAILYRAARRAGRLRGTVLDVGCGSGALALLLAQGASAVTGADINPHAIALSEQNAVWNGIENAEFLCGSLFAPVADRQFDLIVCQPPYVPQPSKQAHHTFLHGGMRGDELTIRILAEASAHLARGGSALVFSDWPLRRGETLLDRLPPMQGGVRIQASPWLTIDSYAAAYGQDLHEHLSQLGIIGVQQALLSLTQGETGIEEQQVLPHEW